MRAVRHQSQVQDRSRAFALADCRLEGWFKGELLVLLGQLKDKGCIEAVELEANVSVVGSRVRAQIEFRLRLNSTMHLCELKALCISQAAGTPQNLAFYFRDDHVGLLENFRKLDQVEGTTNGSWLLSTRGQEKPTGTGRFIHYRRSFATDGQ